LVPFAERRIINMDLKDILRGYVDKFNKDDREIYVQDVDNAHAYEWMKENVPLLECSDKMLEEIYYFRWWVFRKHVKLTEDGYVITEFLPPVPWGGKHNTIICAAGHMITEARWLKCGERLIEDFSLLWLQGKSKTFRFPSWFLHSIYEYCKLKNDFSFGIENLDLMIRYYEAYSELYKCDCGLLGCVDYEDAGEYSISGVEPGPVFLKGIRPTLNSYMAANAYAISRFAERAEREDIAQKYRREYEEICRLMLELLWDGEFFKAVHAKDIHNLPKVQDLPPERNVKELLGYIPWSFDLVPKDKGYEKAFLELKDERGFKSPYGFTTAEQRHPRFLYEVTDHECMWNGYIWPFMTSFTLNAVINLLDHYQQDIITKEDFVDMLLTYAGMHYLEEDGKRVCWSDESMHPHTGDWYSRTVLRNWGWPEDLGGYERGKDYNFSTFGDLVIRGLLGIKAEEGLVIVDPKIPESWDYFRLDNLWIADKCYQIIYDKDGSRYLQGQGLHIIQVNKSL